jgi:glycolate oxidase
MQFIEQLINIIGRENLLSEKAALGDFSHDETEDITVYPKLVVFPKTVVQISSICQLCNQFKQSITVRAAGSGLAGAAIPAPDSIVLSMMHFNKIIQIDAENFQVTTEPGVITEDLQTILASYHMYYPPDPASKSFSTIGGNVATCAGGPHAVKYGVVRDYVLNLEVVLANGEIIWTGANTLKNATAYNLTSLFVGSEGTLGIITKIVLKTIALPRYNELILVSYPNIQKACSSVAKLFQLGYTPSVLEFMERKAVELSLSYLQMNQQIIPEQTAAQLLIEIDGNNKEMLEREIKEIYKDLLDTGPIEVLYAESQQQKELLWTIRKNIGKATKQNNIYKEEDTVVPRANLPILMEFVKQLGDQYGFESVCYGHAGDGNLHINILRNNLDDHFWNNQLKEIIRLLFQRVKELGGTISGEHGIGLVQKDYLDIVFSKTEIELRKKIKAVFDPNNILNPDKIFK